MMKTLLLMMFLMVAAGARTEPQSLTQGNVELMPIEDANGFSVAVKIAEGCTPDNEDCWADRAIVTIHYKAQSSLGELWLTKTSVVELVLGGFAAADGVPVSQDKIERIEVVLVKDLEQERFDWKDDPER